VRRGRRIRAKCCGLLIGQDARKVQKMLEERDAIFIRLRCLSELRRSTCVRSQFVLTFLKWSIFENCARGLSFHDVRAHLPVLWRRHKYIAEGERRRSKLGPVKVLTFSTRRIFFCRTDYI